MTINLAARTYITKAIRRMASIKHQLKTRTKSRTMIIMMRMMMMMMMNYKCKIETTLNA